MNKFKAILLLVMFLPFYFSNGAFSDTTSISLKAVSLDSDESGHMTTENGINVDKVKPVIVLAGPLFNTGSISDITIPTSFKVNDGAYLDFRELLQSVGGKKQVIINSPLKINKYLSDNEKVEVNFLSSTILEDDNGSWSGKILLPTKKTTARANPSPSNTGEAILSRIIDFGAIVNINTNKGVQIKIPSQADKKVGYITDSRFYEIVNICSNNTNPSMSSQQECKIVSGGDLFVWTKHLDELVTYSYPVEEIVEPVSSGGSNSSFIINKKFKGNESVVINNNDKITNSRAVTLTLNGGPNARKMSISNTKNFKGVSKDTYTTTRNWFLPKGKGIKRVYVRYYDKNNVSSKLVNDSILLKYKMLTGDNKKADIDDDNSVGLWDFNLVMVNWGEKGSSIADINKDEKVDIFDLNLIFVYWTM